MHLPQDIESPRRSLDTKDMDEGSELQVATLLDQIKVRDKRREERLKRMKQRQFDQPTLHQLFRIFDSTNSHVLSLSDFQTGLIAMGFKEAEDIEVVSKIMAEIDDDRSGNINESEFVSYFLRRRMEDLGRRLHEVASLGTSTTVQCTEYGVLDAEYLESKELHMNDDADIEQLQALVDHPSPASSAWASSLCRRWFNVNGYHTDTLMLFSQRYGIHEETMKDAGIFQRQKIELLTPGPSSVRTGAHGRRTVSFCDEPEGPAHAIIIIHKLDAVPPLEQCVWASGSSSGPGGRLHHSPDPSLLISQFAIYSINNLVLLTVSKDFLGPQESGSQCSATPPAYPCWDDLKERIRLADADVRVNSSSAKYLAFCAMEVVMEHNYMLRDLLQQWLQDLEGEIQNHTAAHHTLHLYEFAKFATTYLAELRAMAGCLEPIYNTNPHQQAEEDDEVEEEALGYRRGEEEKREWTGNGGGRKKKDIPTLAYFFDNEYIFFRDLTDEIETICSGVEEMISTAKSLSEYYRAVQDDRTNRTLYILTLVTSIFVPAQFLTGLYGMNFEYMPELHWKFSYYIFWVIVVLTTLLAAAWVRGSFTSSMVVDRQRLDL